MIKVASVRSAYCPWFIYTESRRDNENILFSRLVMFRWNLNHAGHHPIGSVGGTINREFFRHSCPFRRLSVWIVLCTVDGQMNWWTDTRKFADISSEDRLRYQLQTQCRSDEAQSAWLERKLWFVHRSLVTINRLHPPSCLSFNLAYISWPVPDKTLDDRLSIQCQDSGFSHHGSFCHML